MTLRKPKRSTSAAIFSSIAVPAAALTAPLAGRITTAAMLGLGRPELVQAGTELVFTVTSPISLTESFGRAIGNQGAVSSIVKIANGSTQHQVVINVP